jgi:hypothetical protein
VTVAGPLPDDVVAAFLDRCRRERADAGLPPKITDPTVLDLVADIVDRRHAGPDQNANRPPR